jgi:hypothetical protein
LEKKYLDLVQFFEGYVRNYRRINLTNIHNRSMITKREIDYFANLGELLGFDVFIEDSKLDKTRGRSRPMDLSWWKWDSRLDNEHYSYLALHLEREFIWNKDEETIDKLFSKTEKEYVPHNVIGIQHVESVERIDFLNKLVVKKNKTQKSNVLMVYRLNDAIEQCERVVAYNFSDKGDLVNRKAICKVDDYGYSFMIFEEELQSNT